MVDGVEDVLGLLGGVFGVVDGGLEGADGAFGVGGVDGVYGAVEVFLGEVGRWVLSEDVGGAAKPGWNFGF